MREWHGGVALSWTQWSAGWWIWEHAPMAWRWMTVVAFWILWGGAAQAQGRLVVAVLPFENHTGDPKMDVLRNGLADMLATDLAASGQVSVVERERLADVSGELSLQQDKALKQIRQCLPFPYSYSPQIDEDQFR